MQFEEFFHKTFERTPRQYQVRVATELLAGRNAVLVAPTGAGKTLAALAPFFYAKKQGRPLADRVLYALPLRSLASALHTTISSLFSGEHKARITIQMGNQPEDPFFEGDVVFTTIDQLLSAYVGLPYGTSKASANIPPGALVGALVVIDEFHLLSYGEALPTFLDMMKRLHPYTQFLVMTATVPEQNVTEVTRLLQGVPLLLTEAERDELPEKTRVLNWHDMRLDAEMILNHMGKKTLVVVNTVHRAQQLFLTLQNVLQEQGNDLEMRCLHSQLFAKGRSETEQWVLQRFAQGANENALLITTQVVEAGLDISADVLLTELCPANALLQRVGRCARFPNEKGTVHVYSVEGATRPYVQELMQKTETFLQRLESLVLHTEWEQELIEFVHGESDAVQMKFTLSHLPDRRDKINKAYVNGTADMSSLVRSVDSVNVLIHPDPQTLCMELRPERVSVSSRKVEAFLKRHFEACEERESPVGWYPEFEEDSWNREVIVWKEISSEKDVNGKRLLCLAPPFVHYHADVGLLFTPPEEGTGVLSKETLTEPERSGQRFDYFRETYVEHVAKVRELYQEEEKIGVHQVADARLTQALKLPPETTPARLAAFTGALHDIGKLTVEFQTALRAWQRDTRGLEEQAFLAHTDNNGNSSADRESSKLAAYRRPPHAVEGSIMAFRLLMQMAELAESEEQGEFLLGAMTLAIMRHHHAFSKEHRSFTIAKDVTATVQESLAGLFHGKALLNETSYYHKFNFHEELIEPELLVLYWYLVRRLRLNDRRSQERLAEERRREGEPSHVS